MKRQTAYSNLFAEQSLDDLVNRAREVPVPGRHMTKEEWDAEREKFVRAFFDAHECRS